LQATSSLQPATRELPQIVFQHADFLIVQKPAHWLVHPTRPTGEPTLLSWLQERFEEVSLVNRLDRETSGLVITALSSSAASQFGKLMMQRLITKEYWGIVYGEVKVDHGKINSPLGRIGISGTNPIYLKQGIRADGATALTEFWVEQKNSSFSLLRIQAHTGRLHQIRVHLASIGHPLAGDKIYGPDPQFYLEFIKQGWTEEMEKQLLLRRHALHSYRLCFCWNDETFRFSLPLADDLQKFLESS
jgi:23S rRNA pseudouridine1911/1915/1917 synthase